jgi:hypothetical protein
LNSAAKEWVRSTHANEPVIIEDAPSAYGNNSWITLGFSHHDDHKKKKVLTESEQIVQV